MAHPVSASPQAAGPDTFAFLLDELCNFDTLLDEEQAHAPSVAASDAHKEELKSVWDSLKQEYYSIVRDPHADPLMRCSIKQQYTEAYKTYIRCVSKIGDCHASPQRSFSPQSSSSPHPRETAIRSSFHLPPCETECFTGEYSKWPSFRDLFQAVYVQNSRMADVERLFHLRHKTKGEAHEIVCQAPLTNAGFGIAWKNLCQRFENKRVLVNNQIKILLSLQPMSAENSACIRLLQREINSCITNLQLLDIRMESWDAILVYIASSKLSASTLSLWEESLEIKIEIPTWKELDSFLTRRFHTLESVAELHPSATSGGASKNPTGSRNGNPRQMRSFQNSVDAPQTDCKMCNSKTHALRRCPKFSAKSVQERWELVKQWRLCFNCLAWNHSLRDCPSQNTCLKCKERHNTLLHKESLPLSNGNTSPPKPVTEQPSSSHASRYDRERKAFPNQIQSTEIQGDTAHIQSCLAIQSKTILLGTACISIVRDGVHYPARALIDSGSEGTFISERIFNLLRLPFRATNTMISGVSSTVTAKASKLCKLLISSPINKHIQIPSEAFVLKTLMGTVPSANIDIKAIQSVPTFQLADPNFTRSAHIDVLIGADILPDILLPGVKQKVCNTLLAQDSVFGWILSGPVPRTTTKSYTTVIQPGDDTSLEKQLLRFWEIEDIPQKKIISEADKYCEEYYRATTKKSASGRYEVHLPFRPEFPNTLNLGESKASAFALFRSNDSRLNRNPHLKADYEKVLQEYLELHQMRKVVDEPQAAYYMPHHAVLKPDSLTTKVRVVFNASHKTTNGHSLNDMLYPGPVLQADLMILVLKWRFFRFVFNGDLEKMYRQILVAPEHTPFQRVLMRNPANSFIDQYELLTVTFGVNCAPYLAIRTILQLAQDVQGKLPLASEILRNYMYVDDVLGGAHDMENAIDARDQLITALAAAKFNIRKWTSNCIEILKGLPADHLLREDFLDFEDTSQTKTLGIRWNALSDEFLFVPHVSISTTTSYSKRNVLSQIAKFFDPVGWLSPIIIRAKIIMQDIWKAQVDWDEEIPVACQHQWRQFLADYSDVKTITIPRWVGYSPKCDIQFHHFCDASENAYAAAIYVRVELEGQVTTQLLMAKSRVAPVKTQSIPRLELCGAVLVAELSDSCLPQLPIHESSKYFWTDSTIVLAWLSKPACHWTTFIANRVSKIVQTVGPANWLHIESAQNPADLGTRGRTPDELRSSQLWWHGPKWLTLTPSEWPTSTNVNMPENEIEAKVVKTCIATNKRNFPILERFSSFPRAMRVIAYIFRFYYKCHPRHHKKHTVQNGPVAKGEILNVTERLVLLSQQDHFEKELKALRNKEEIPPTSSILTLNPFIDANGVIRSAGRLIACPTMSYNERHPVILPYDCPLTRLYVHFIHQVSLHGESRLMLRLIRMNYWIPRVKNLIKTVVHKCKTCIIYRKRVQSQLMGSLPVERATISRPFTNTGLDFAGPFDVRSSNLKKAPLNKCYVCVFVCFATKAIQLECTTDLSTAAFLAAFQRFISRRGCPANIYSDNGTTFVGADKAMAKEFVNACRFGPLSPNSFQQPNWHFIPPSAPHMGGLWEAAVKSFKIHFRKIAGPYKYTYEEFSTLLTRIEACLNSRPIAPMGDDPSDMCALTPGHFLTGGPMLAPAEEEVREEPVSIVNRWKKLTAVYQNFCQQWKHDYLALQAKRDKWTSASPNIQPNDLVVIREDHLMPTEWRLGRIQKLYPGADNLVRVADVLTQRGLIRRPLVKLILLPKN